MHEIYRPVLERRFTCPIHSSGCPKAEPPALMVTTINSAELIKHASNSFLALKISYANMLSDFAEKLGADMDEVVRAVGMDPRIGESFLRAGIGFGGFCLPKDLQAFMSLAERCGVDFSLLKEVENINSRRIDHFVEKLRRALWVMHGKQIGVLGLAFKPNTDDIRFSPAIDVVERLIGEGARVRATIPKRWRRRAKRIRRFLFAIRLTKRRAGADALVIARNGKSFASWIGRACGIRWPVRCWPMAAICFRPLK